MYYQVKQNTNKMSTKTTKIAVYKLERAFLTGKITRDTLIKAKYHLYSLERNPANITALNEQLVKRFATVNSISFDTELVSQ